MKTLKDVSVGETVRIKRLDGEGALKRRLMDMGFTNGCSVYIRKVAPLGDPVEITIRGYELGVRRNDAQCIEIE
jgi:ferrous iron transport protein A